jgi:hypothetical protein
VAAAINKAVGIQPDVVVGNRGEFTVWVDGKQVAQKGWPTTWNGCDAIALQGQLEALIPMNPHIILDLGDGAARHESRSDSGAALRVTPLLLVDVAHLHDVPLRSRLR